MKKFILIVLLIPILMSACSKSDLVLLSDGDVLPKNICENLDNNVIIVHETGCSACAVSLPRIRGIEKTLRKTYQYIDLAIPQERDYMLNKSFSVLHIPTLIVDCKAYVGTKTDKEFMDILQNA